MVYVTIFALLVVTSALCSSRSSDRLATAAWCLFLFLFVGLRRNVGCDFDQYEYLFEQTRGHDYSTIAEYMEPSFALIYYLVHSLDMPFYWVNIFCAAVFICGVYAFSLRQASMSGFLALTFPLLFVNMAMSGIRQATAIGLLMLGFIAFLEAKRIKFLVIVLAAASFHTSAIVFFPLFLLIGRQISLFAIASVFLLLGPAVILFSGGSLEVYQARYVGSGVEAAGGLIRAALVAAAGLIFLAFLKNKWRRHSPDDFHLLWILSMLTIPLVPLSFVSSVIADRLGYYLMPAQVAIFSRSPTLVKRDALGLLISWGPWAAMAGFFLIWIFSSPIAAECYFPYDSYLF